MDRSRVLKIVLGSLSIAFAACAAGAQDGIELTGPYSHKNLDVFFIRNKGGSKEAPKAGKGMLTLEEALAQGKLVVRETGEVNELEVENLSDKPIFIQAGDMVKGGRQDRALQDDMVIKPKSGKVPVKSFCVESGRWSQRSGEKSQVFSSSAKQLASTDLKLAARKSKDQGEVWQKVDEAQSKLGGKVGVSVRDGKSESSLQLSLENEKVVASVKAYIDAVRIKAGDLKGAIGFAVAVNGEMMSADYYGDPELFAKLLPKLLEASATEALLAYDAKKAGKSVTAKAASSWIDGMKKASAQQEDVDEHNKLNVSETKEAVMFESRTADDADGYLHRSLLKK
jgi:hypothetical protein